MSVLAEMSVWMAHLRQTDPRLMRLVHADEIICHPYVITELACGSPPKRAALIEGLSDFDSPRIATQEEIRHSFSSAGFTDAAAE